MTCKNLCVVSFFFVTRSYSLRFGLLINMRSYKIVTILASVFAFSALAAAQVQTIQQAVNSFAQTHGHPYGSSNFQALAAKHGISFDDGKNYTLFVPYNYALPDDANAVSQALLQYHISTDSIPPQNAASQVLANTLLVGTGSSNNFTDLPAGLPQRLIVNHTSNGNVSILSYGQDNTTSSDYVISCSNGYIYLIVSALKLPLTPSNAFNNNNNVGGLNDMGAALASVSYRNQSGSAVLDHVNGMTFFAVNNAAFANVKSQDNKDNTKITNTTHMFAAQTVIGGVVAYTDYLSSHSTLVNALGETLNVTIVNGVYYVNGVQVIYANIPVSNGVMHVMSHLFDDKTSNSTKNGNGTVPNNNGNTNTITDVNNNNTSAATSLHASSSIAAASIALAASALFFVFSL